MSNTRNKVLIVEDNIALRTIIKKNVQNAGYEIYEAENGEVGLKMLSLYDDIGLVLLDIMMPKLDGIGFIEKVSSLKKEFGFKICMLTAKSQTTDVKNCLKLGADDYIVKPFDKDLLLEKVKILFDGFGHYTFATIPSEIEGSILRQNSSIQISITSLSENEITFSTKTELPVNAKVHLRSQKLGSISGILEPLLIRIYKCSKDGLEYNCRASFIGLKDDFYKRIRAITTREEVLHE